jgi:hypothetical protein
MSKTVYHYSTRNYERDQLITQETDHYDRLTNEQRGAEDELRAKSKEAADKRATSIYIE